MPLLILIFDRVHDTLHKHGMSMDLSQHRIPGSHEAYYIPNFITSDEEIYLIRKICESPRHKWKALASRRLQLLGGEITSKNNLFSQSMPSYVDRYPDLVTRLHDTGAFKSSPHEAPNHIILNEYLPGQGIMPHEDGPTYHPVVATVSLGSHAVFHYYKYKSDALSVEHPPLSPGGNEGRVIDPNPVLSVLLEPRSVIITTGALYTSHLHGIQETEEDAFIPAKEGGLPLLRDLGTPVANGGMLKGELEQSCMAKGGVLTRGTRYSLTCRDVERVISPRSLGRR